LLPSVGEMIKQCNEVKIVSDISANVNLHLTTSKDSILESAKIYEERDITQIHQAFQMIVNRVDSFSKQK